MALPPAKRPVLFLVLVAVLTGILAWVVLTASADVHEDLRQDALAPFYTPPSPVPAGAPGSIIRTEPLGITVSGGRAVRMLYRSQDGRGRPTVSSGMAFIPRGPAPAGGRPVVAWAHGTVGLADQCAPSRIDNPIRNLPWVEEMLARGWVVAATDYVGLGTPGTSGYLIAADEGHDVINSVRAASRLPGAATSRRWVSWGHSQGGHAALVAGDMARSYAPELDLVAIATAAPAADLKRLLALQWNQPVAWVIGAEVVGTWPSRYPELDPTSVITANGRAHLDEVLGKCIAGAALTAEVRQDLLGQDFFARNPWDVPSWRRRFIQNTPAPTPRDLPLFITQSITDNIVLPRTTATLVPAWCRAGVRITTMWLNGVTHNDTAIVSGPSVVQWIGQRLAGEPAPDDCGAPTPVPALAGTG